jgi:hypothetical protein
LVTVKHYDPGNQKPRPNDAEADEGKPAKQDHVLAWRTVWRLKIDPSRGQPSQQWTNGGCHHQ